MFLLQEYVKYYNVKISVVMVPDSGVGQPLAFYDNIALTSGGVSRVIEGVESRSIRTYVDLTDAFMDLLPNSAMSARTAAVTSSVTSVAVG